MTILLVDDEPVALSLLKYSLERAGRRVVTAASAGEALDWLRAAHGVELVVTDQNMGGMTGLELMAVLRDDLRWRSLPVILCTAAADRATVEAAIRLGARHFLVKPIRPAKLLETVDQALADRAPTMQDHFGAIRSLGMSEPAYRNFVKVSRRRLLDLRQEILTARQHGAQAAGPAIRRIREPADALGAARLVAAVDRFAQAEAPDSLPMLLDLVFIELACLDEVLEVAERPPLIGRAT